ncbi:MAG: class I tRNA ligase family protein, partial [Candidatus Binatia bacterium]
KMSKSLGNVIAPQEIIKAHGAEILRLWASAEDYRDDVRISDEILNRLVEAYRRVRNTARFLLGNLYDFHPEKDSVQPPAMAELDRWILHRTQEILARCREAYDRFEFHIVYHSLNNFCSVDLSALYLDIVKDRLYCEGANSKERRSAQTAMYRIVETLVHLMAPILSFTAEEIWGYLPDQDGRSESIFLSTLPTPDENLIDEKLGNDWEKIFKVRGEILKALESARNAGLIGHSLDAKIVLFPDAYTQDASLLSLIRNSQKRWPEILIVSQVELGKGPLDASGTTEPAQAAVSYPSALLGGPVVVSKADGEKCQRCWNYSRSVGTDPSHPTVCERCSRVLRSGVSP